MVKITRTLLAYEDHLLELHNVWHGEKNPVDGSTPTLVEVPVIASENVAKRMIMCSTIVT